MIDNAPEFHKVVDRSEFEGDIVSMLTFDGHIFFATKDDIYVILDKDEEYEFGKRLLDTEEEED